MPAEMPQTRTSLVSELRVSTPAAGFFAASFLHRTSRAPDPHVHSGIEDRGRRIAANPDIPGQPAAAISVPTSPHDTTTSLHCWLPNAVPRGRCQLLFLPDLRRGPALRIPPMTLPSRVS